MRRGAVDRRAHLKLAKPGAGGWTATGNLGNNGKGVRSGPAAPFQKGCCKGKLAENQDKRRLISFAEDGDDADQKPDTDGANYQEIHSAPQSSAQKGQ